MTVLCPSNVTSCQRNLTEATRAMRTGKDMLQLWINLKSSLWDWECINFWIRRRRGRGLKLQHWITMVPSENISVFLAAESCLNCSSTTYPPMNVAKAVLLGLLLVVFLVFGVLGNILVILSVLIHHHWRSVTHYFIANLAAADLLLSSAVLPFSATSEALGRWVFSRSFCSVWAALDVLCCTASILSLCVISIDRCLAVSYPLRYPAMATGRRGLTAVAALWGLSAAISVGPLFGWKEPEPEDETVCRITEEPGYALFSALGSFYIPLAIILAMYCRVYTVARRETRTLRKGSEAEGVETEGVTLRIHRGNAAHAEKREDEKVKKQHQRGTFSLSRMLKFSREEKAAKTLSIVVGCFILCWLPFFLVLPIGTYLWTSSICDLAQVCGFSCKMLLYFSWSQKVVSLREKPLKSFKKTETLYLKDLNQIIWPH